jgi:exodeoxyribonuclease VII large subunit
LRAWQHRLSASERVLAVRVSQLSRAPRAPSVQSAALALARASASLRRTERALVPEPQRVDRLTNALNLSVRRRLSVERDRVIQAAHLLELADPSRVLARGFAMIRSLDGRPLMGVEQVAAAQQVQIEVHDGSVRVTVEGVERRSKARVGASPPDSGEDA